MILFDLNILIYAHREDQAHYDYFRNRLEAKLDRLHLDIA